VTGREFDLFALIGLLMLMGIVVTNAIMPLDLVQHKPRKDYARPQGCAGQ
jgi:multidrug efflux pump subunit AcrB